MRSIAKWAGAAGLSLAALLLWHSESLAAALPEVHSVLESTDTGSGDVSLVVIGRKVSKLKQFWLRDSHGTLHPTPTVSLKSKSMIVLRLPDSVEAGEYRLSVATNGPSAERQELAITIAKGVGAPGAVDADALDPALRSDLDDAVTVGGLAPATFVDITATQVISGLKTFDQTVTANVATGDGVVGIAGASSGLVHGVSGQSESPDGAGVFGANTATTGDAYGLHGQSASSAGAGVFGSGYRGISGSSSAAGGAGVFGANSSSSGATYGVHGQSSSSGGRGVLGESLATSGFTYGVQGSSRSDNGRGVYGFATATTGSPRGVFGETDARSGFGVFGMNTSTEGFGIAIQGESFASGSTAIRGFSHGTNSGTGVYGQVSGSTGTGVSGRSTSSTGSGVGVKGWASAPDGIGVQGRNAATSGTAYGVVSSTSSTSGVAIYGITGATTGSPTAILARTGASGNALVAENNSATTTASTTTATNIAIFKATPTGGGALANRARIDRDGRGYFNGGTAASGADFAESVDVEGDAASYEPGDVMVVSLDGDRRFALSSAPQSTLVAGVYSTKPALLGSAHPDVAGTNGYTEGEIPLGVVGIVPTKVCDENGPIRRGDLLVTSSTPGHAMRAPSDTRPGTIVGKALGELELGVGMIEILLSLQ